MASEFGPQSLIATLIEQGVTEESTLVQLLGAARHDLTLPDLESRLVASGMISSRRLSLVKAVATGLPTVEETTGARAILPERAARAAGAIVLDMPTPSVAFVEPTLANLDIVAQALGKDDFTRYVITAVHFRDLLAAVYQNQTVEVRPEVPDILAVLDECIRVGATDIHLQVGRPPLFRLNGSLIATTFAPLDAAWLDREAHLIMPEAGRDDFVRTKSYDFAYPYGDLRFRVNLGRDRNGTTVTARLLASTIPSMEDLALPEAVRAFTELERGLVLVTGPTGSGKSTTIASVLDHIARNQARHIITLEDPIEYLLTPGPNAAVNQRELGNDFESFLDALRQAMRQDPDVIFVGEMRDAETAKAAVTAAETGHLVFSTLHTYDAQSSVTRLVSMYEGEHEHAHEKLAYILKGVVSQTLVPRASSKGRVAALEILTSTPAVSNNLRTSKGLSSLRSTMQTSRSEGMQTMEAALAALVLRGVIRQEDAEYRARDLEEFRRYLSHLDQA